MMNLTRNKKSNAVVARIMRQGETHGKTFPVKEYGSWKKAETAGASWVESMKKQLPASQSNEPGRMTARNSSGFVGVYLSERKVRKPSGNQYHYWAWIARWPGCPHSGGVVWNVSSNLSDNDAFVLAVLSRQKESTDRKALRAELKRIHGKKTYKAILEKKELYLETTTAR